MPCSAHCIHHHGRRPTLQKPRHARIRLRRIKSTIDELEDSMKPDEYLRCVPNSRLNTLLYYAICTITDLMEKLDSSQPDHWDIVLNQLSLDLGMDL